MNRASLMLVALLAAAAACLFGVRMLWPGPNLIANPDFSGGDSGFFSSYIGSTESCEPGEYVIGGDPGQLNGLWRGSAVPHSGGKMMIVNGGQEPFMIVWGEGPIPVEPHHTYYFSVFVTSIFADSPPVFTFRINGAQVGPKFRPAAKVGQWTEFYVAWKSVRNHRAALSIVDENTEGYGNDFALDDFSLATSPFTVAQHQAWERFLAWQGSFSFSAPGIGFGLMLIGLGLFATCGGLVVVGVGIFRLAAVYRRGRDG